MYSERKKRKGKVEKTTIQQINQNRANILVNQIKRPTPTHNGEMKN